jgi:YfiR/HmsC-like
MFRYSKRWRRTALWVAALCFATGGPAQTALTESQAKASALFNFARYVEWPERAFASREAPFVFCVAGRDSLGSGTSALEGRVLNGRQTQFRRVLGIEELRGCHALYIGEPEERRLLPMLRAVAGEPVMTVGDLNSFIDAGGAIGIVLDEGRMRFDINRAALEQSQLRASSNLLRLARNTRQP